MEWNVYICDNGNIEKRNVFHLSVSFDNALKKLDPNSDDFEKKLDSACMYSYWSKSEYEIILTELLPTISSKERDRITTQQSGKYREIVQLETEKKIDVYDQLKLNWNEFVKYTKESLRNESKSNVRQRRVSNQ